MSPTASNRLDRRQLRELLEPVVAAAGYDLEDLVDQRAGSRRLIRVVVDGDGGVSLDDIAEVSRLVSAALDERDALGESPYVLELTSPGVDRPLTEPRHWRRAVGRLVKAELAAGGELVGRVVAADGEGATLALDGGERRLGYAAVTKARVQVEFNRAAPEDEEPWPDGEDGDGQWAHEDGAEPSGPDVDES